MTSAADIMDCTMDNAEQNVAALAERVSPATMIRAHEPLAKRTTLRVGGPADVYVEPATEEDLAAVLNFCGERELPFFVLGRGSNLLVRDGGFRGVVICLAQPFFSRIEIVGKRLLCGAGAKLKNVAVEAKRSGLTGLEFLEGIPGSVGGALRMNAGAMGSETFNAVESVRFMDSAGEIFEKSGSEMAATYRSCALLKTHIALSATFHAKPASRAEVEERMKLFSEKRWSSQPAAPSAGCMFKNPPTIAAGKLIDELGLKGLRVGGAVVSSEHGNFLVNDGNATARDVLELIETVKQRVKAEYGIDLHTEVEIIGDEE
jgi:UDP-N-acetylenolpyruvoylglucosamine reductase